MRTAAFTLHPGLFAVFSSRADGDMGLRADPDAGRRARHDLAVAAGADPARLRFMSQVHSATVVVPTATATGPIPTGDALVDTTGRLAPSVLTADCVPVLLAARTPRQGAVAAIHAGRRGLLDGVLENAVASVHAAGGSDLEAWVGPSICGGCYEVPSALRDEAEAASEGIGSTTSWGTPSLDLPGAAAARLRRLGVRVGVVAECTLHGDEHFSYRGGDVQARNVSTVVRLEPAAHATT